MKGGPGTPTNHGITGYDQLNNIDTQYQSFQHHDTGNQLDNQLISTPERYFGGPNSPTIPYTNIGGTPVQLYTASDIYDNEEESIIGNNLHTPTSRSRRPSTISFEQFNKWRKTVLPKWALSSTDTQDTTHEIEYSVFKPPNGYTNTSQQTHPRSNIDKFEFHKVVNSAIEAIETGAHNPQRIAQGSSGSYFIYNKTHQIIGVFKPKDEEPYGPISPKWTKWMHRTFFPCFFGRSCLIPNLGYICESGASLLDRQLQSNIVPYTDVVNLSSSNFYYSIWDKRTNGGARTLPKKVGSFQLFLDGYEEADLFFRKHPLPETYTPYSDNIPNFNEPIFEWTCDVIAQFRQELEKLVILDYIMRNTDRGLDNWMIKIEWVDIQDPISPFTAAAAAAAHNPDSQKNKQYYSQKPILKIGAIDSGLSFPWKHPDEWRSFPFGWLFLPLQLIGHPFSQQTRDHYLSILTSTTWWEETTLELKNLFSKDTDFKERMWNKQLAVIKGQAFNVVETLQKIGHGPLELTRRSKIMVWDDIIDVPVYVDQDSPMSLRKKLKKTESPIKQNKTQMGSKIDTIPEIDIQQSLHDDPFMDAGQDINTENGYNYNNRDGITTKKVIIERLERCDSKGPVFTWC